MNAKKLEIGICDDQPRDLKRIRDVLCSSLEAMGGWDASIHLFRRGRDLCEESQRTTFSLLFLDVMMPDLSGFDLASRIRMHRGETQVVFVSNLTRTITRRCGLCARACWSGICSGRL